MGILSVRKRSAYKVTELKFWRKNTSLPVKFKTFRPGNNHNHNNHHGRGTNSR
ncbi:MAG: hypothetical protein MUP19_06535 [Candidatus Aminicenantes bacterium]|nr:hypothetical protein [Candidatus Aminicenantes bacterium]